MNAAAGLVEVRVPDMGNFKDVAIIDVLVKPGEKIEVEAPLVTLETEKATMDVPSTVGGVVEKIHIAKGGTVSPGDLIVTVRSEGTAAEGAADGASAGGSAAGVPGSAGSAGGASAAGSAGAASPGAGGASGGGSGSVGGAGSASGAGASGGPGAASQAAAAGAAQGASAGPAASGTAQAGAAPGQGGAGQAPAQSGSGGGGAPAGASKAGTAGDGHAGAAGGQPGAAAAGSSSPSAAGFAGSAATAGQSAGASAQLPAGSGPSGQSSAQSGNGAGPARTIAGRPDLPPINEPGFSRAHAGPSVRRFARELGVDLTQVKGGGFKGRVTHDDVKAFVKKFLAAGAKPAPAVAKGPGAPGAGGPSSLPAVPVIDFSVFGEIETRPLSRIQKISGPRLHASWVNIPHVTQFDEADITELEDARTKLKQKALQAGIKLTPLAFIVRACVKALQEFPLFNSSLDPAGANLILKKYIHVGFAADTPNGLVVPVVRDANRKDVYEIARQLGELSEKARAGKLLAGEMQGGSFTISSLGGIGGTAFTPIINAPEVAILGISRSAMKPIFRDGAFVPRLILPLSLSYDHRVIDGASAARFTTFLAQTLADPRVLTEAVP
jgi:pyruvate dehydrogenase E2 component (dihydrolipoamide acetyltransferase)